MALPHTDPLLGTPFASPGLVVLRAAEVICSKRVRSDRFAR